VIPALFTIGPFTVYGYGFFVSLGFLFGTLYTVKAASRDGISRDISLDMIVWVFVAGLLGARILYILTDLDYYLASPVLMLKIWEGGLVYYGGFLAAVPVFFLVSKKRGINGLKFSDSISKGLVIGHFFGRLGCFTKGCCYGLENNTFGMIFPELNDHIRHLPTQLFEAAGLAAIFFILNSVKKKYDGQVLSLYLALYGLLRFIMEYFRGDFRGPSFLALSVSQWISLGLLSAAVLLRVAFSGKKKNADTRV